MLRGRRLGWRGYERDWLQRVANAGIGLERRNMGRVGVTDFATESDECTAISMAASAAIAISNLIAIDG